MTGRDESLASIPPRLNGHLDGLKAGSGLLRALLGLALALLLLALALLWLSIALLRLTVTLTASLSVLALLPYVWPWLLLAFTAEALGLGQLAISGPQFI